MRGWLDSMQPWGAFLLRIVLGVTMMYHGWNKVVPASGFHGSNTFSAIDHWGHTVAGMGFPYWLGYISALTEFLGGFLLIFGLLTRLAAFMVACNMLVALVKVDVRHGYAGSQYPLALFVIALMLLFYGAGAAAVDRKVGFA
jgi:putative oxidoreductase